MQQNQWYIINDNQRMGPMPASELPKYGLNPASLVWRPGMSEWQTAATCPELSLQLSYSHFDENAPGKNYASPQNGTYVPASDHEENRHTDFSHQRQPDPNNPGNWTQPQPQNYFASPTMSDKSNIVAGLLAIFIGYLGIQYFYIGKIKGGVITILLSLVTCGGWSLLTFIQGIYMLTLTPQQFEAKYVNTSSVFPLF